MYSKYAHIVDTKSEIDDETGLKSFQWQKYHHVSLNQEFKYDCQVWIKFLVDEWGVYNRPMVDVDAFASSQEIYFYSDTSKAKTLGFGAIFETNWLFGKWEDNFISKYDPSIEFLELFALTVGLLTWETLITNSQVIIFCVNMSVVEMINQGSSTCSKCMILLRLLTLNGLQYNRRVLACHVRSKDNGLSDALSHLQFECFRCLGPHMNKYPHQVDPRVWPVSKFWTQTF